MNNIDNQSLRQRLHRVIPGGAHTYSRGDDQFPQNAPALLERGKGAYVWDIKGNKFLDYGMALRSVTIGYADDRITAAALAEMNKGVGLTRASMTELLAAERICEMVPAAEMVKFAKNGSNATTAAIKIARSYTGKKYICVPRQQPFFSFDDWFIGTTAIKRGVMPEHAATTLLFDYNDINTLKDLFEKYPNKIAAVMLEPATHITPCDNLGNQDDWLKSGPKNYPKNGTNFLKQVQTVTHDNDALLIFDEMITGFRWHIGGAQTFYDITPDLATFGKAMANGFALAAVVGKQEFMEVGSIDKPGMKRTFLLSSTHGGEMTALGAFLAATHIYEQEDVSAHLWDYGRKLRNGLVDLAASQGLTDLFKLEGPPVALNYVTNGSDGKPCPILRTIFAQEMLRSGVMMPWISLAQAHGETELQITLEAASSALKVYAQAVNANPQDFLEGEAVKPVFRETN